MQIEVNIESGKYLFVAAPKIKGITTVNYPRAGKWVMGSHGKELNCWKIKCEENWKVIQLLSQINEKDIKDIVKNLNGEQYDYLDKEDVYYHILFHQLLKANKIYTVNPIQLPLIRFSQEAVTDIEHKWQEAQKTVSEEWLIIKIIK